MNVKETGEGRVQEGIAEGTMSRAETTKEGGSATSSAGDKARPGNGRRCCQEDHGAGSAGVRFVLKKSGDAGTGKEDGRAN